MTALRITGGTLRGRRVPIPKRGGDLRPTSERARQAYFNIVGARVDGARFLDLFAGTGIFSFEALSRGAESSVAIDLAGAQIAAIEQLATEWELSIRSIRADALTGIKRLRSTVFDLVFADPPYAYDSYDALLLAIDESITLADDAVIAIEHRRHAEPFTATTGRLRLSRRAEYGEVWISFFTTASAGNDDDDAA